MNRNQLAIAVDIARDDCRWTRRPSHEADRKERTIVGSHAPVVRFRFLVLG
jgi:hypothetical protein